MIPISAGVRDFKSNWKIGQELRIWISIWI